MSTFSVLEAYARLRREVGLIGAAKLKAMDLGQKQMMILYRLSQSPCTMGELAAYSQSDKASVTRTVEALAKAGWIERHDDGGDRRKRVIRLTRKGCNKARKARDVRTYIGMQLEETLTHHEREQLAELMDKVVDGLLKKRA
ncbi:MAG: MarR family transcriptional regulator [Bdellovibrionales bacterium]|nr:MarR family transcriptional regulator [Bdellovibrionales bacterium]